MKDISEFIGSGIIESYVLGISSPDEAQEVQKMAAAHHEVRAAIDQFSEAFERIALANAVPPDPTVKPFLMATIDYMERMDKGEAPTFPPLLHEGSKIDDYGDWLKRADMSLPTDFSDLHARIIGYTPQVITAIVWIKQMAPQEVHDNEFEKFLIVEGTCDIVIADDVHQLVRGDFLEIPLHKNHHVKVTSDIPCKVILQRVAAWCLGLVWFIDYPDVKSYR